MDLGFTYDELKFRDDLVETFHRVVPAAVRRKVLATEPLTRQEILDNQKALNSCGLAVPHWPVEWGGRAWSAVQLYIYREQMHLCGVPEPNGMTVDMLGPMLAAFASEEQKRRFLPKMANLDYWFCQGFSEPNAGSDLASLRTSAERSGDGYLINGQKMWTTFAHWSNWIFVLCRTDPQAEKKQLGLSLLLVPLDSPGVSVRPIITIDRRHETNEVFFDNVQVPAANLVGEEGKAWGYAKYLLGHERLKTARIGLSKQILARIKRLAREVKVRGRPIIEDPLFADRVATVDIELKALEMTAMRVLDSEMKKQGAETMPASSVLKLKGTEVLQAATELLLQLAGPEALPYVPDGRNRADVGVGGPDWATTPAATYFFFRVFSISAGSNEIQRNVIAKAFLGL